MQELVLTQSGSTLEGDSVRENTASLLRGEFEARLAECWPLAFRVAHVVLRNAADAEDVAQEALLRAHNNFGRLRDPTRFRPWLVRIVFRLALDRWRSARRRERRETEWSSFERQSASQTAEQLAAASEFRSRLERALDELPEKFRLVLLLVAIHGHTLEEVAEILNAPLGTVKSRLFLARKKLAEKLR
jgi:RNA polymerase sigma-70 factor (ECF subfamily)